MPYHRKILTKFDHTILFLAYISIVRGATRPHEHMRWVGSGSVLNLIIMGHCSRRLQF